MPLVLLLNPENVTAATERGKKQLESFSSAASFAILTMPQGSTGFSQRSPLQEPRGDFDALLLQEYIRNVSDNEK